MKSLSYLNKYFYKYRWRLLLGILFIIINNYFGARIPVIIGESMDILKGNKTLGPGETLFLTAISLAGFVILFNIIKGFFLFLTRQTLIVMSRYIEFDLKNEIFEKYQQLDYKFYKSQSTGDLMNRISEDVSQVRQYLGPGIMYSVNLIALFPFSLYQMLKINTELAFYALVPLPVMAVLIYLVSTRMNKLSKDVQKEQSRLSTLGQETFSGIRVIKAYIQEKHARENFEESSQSYLKKTMRLVRTNALFTPTISLLIGTSTLLSIYIGGIATFDVKSGVTTGQILTIILLIYNLTWPFASIGWVTSINQRAAASQERINEFLRTEPAIKNTNQNPVETFEEIRFEHVSFRYKPDLPDVLSNINFTLRRGESLGIIGKTGSGKSTLLQLIVRQLDPSSGKVIYNREELASVNLGEYRKQISVVPQDVFLFSDTIKNNIAFGALDLETVSQEEIEEAAKNAHVLHNIEAFPEKFETLLGERGVNLSGGQKQRVSIARALIRKPQILLLDDCLSAVDTETEEIILRNLKKLNKESQITTVIVSHRISSLRNADYILVLDDGRIVEEGKPTDLLGKDSRYREMYEKQLIEESNPYLTED
ncbi:ABC transporter ATP-binding protein [Fluviicola sp.]|jgi:ATP-binding cassette subfamily B protein|uniref:ABC transporter ATP-binding protein n=1 Tax=Fluviicola sp. TaxID=1917219 RepID=UPI002824B8B5|nr:ABC transporter ATP-binding protein [Fluviicola sp.]MDR0802574.1 ABC transporter ATP-binding protein/permease [Fluviicola sp.]